MVVLIHGRPVSWGEGNELLAALLAAWRPGEQGVCAGVCGRVLVVMVVVASECDVGVTWCGE